MLSILIPIFNWEVIEVVAQLHRQCTQLGIDFEIRCYEDGSADEYLEKNKPLKKYKGVIYRVLAHNIGRSRIRNLLAEEACYPSLLFLDCDSGITHDRFIADYLSLIKEGAILYGGRIYADQLPQNKAHILHWLYGHHRETAIAKERQKAPYNRFMTNNFLISKSIFVQIGFEERLLQYGHEDTLFGQEMQARGIPILHLDNPVLHLGLEEVEVFLEKNRQAMENLCFLAKEYPGLETHLLQTINRLKAWKLNSLTLVILHKLYPFLIKNLFSSHPRLRALDLFKLYHFLDYDQQRIINTTAHSDS